MNDTPPRGANVRVVPDAEVEFVNNFYYDWQATVPYQRPVSHARLSWWQRLWMRVRRTHD